MGAHGSVCIRELTGVFEVKMLNTRRWEQGDGDNVARPRAAGVSWQNNIKHCEETSIKWFEYKWSYMGVVFRDCRQLVLYSRLSASACYIIIVIVYALCFIIIIYCTSFTGGTLHTASLPANTYVSPDTNNINITYYYTISETAMESIRERTV